MDPAESLPEPPPAPSWWRVVAFGRKPRATALRSAVWLGVGLGLVFLCTVVARPVRVSGISMEPTYHNGSFNFINRAAYWWGEPRRGDVVGYAFTGQHAMLLKRIIGLPGETIQLRGGRVFINGEELDEPYLVHRVRWNTKPVTLKEDEYYLIGDNRGMPQENHDFGRGNRGKIIGKALW
jgi:signal peptidase I